MKSWPDHVDINLCNSCHLREKIRKGNIMAEKAKILVECDFETQSKIEEICIREGISFSDFFLSLYNDHYKLNEEPLKECGDDEQPKKRGPKPKQREY